MIAPRCEDRCAVAAFDREGGRALAQLIAGLGYIGAELARQLLAAGEAVVGVDNLFSTDASALRSLAAQPGFTLVEGSIASPKTLARAFTAAPVSTVFALAAQASAHPAAASPRYTETANLLAPRLLFAAAAEHGVNTVVYGSSMRVYGDVPVSQARETDTYGRFTDLSHLSKVYGEKLLEMYAHQHGLRGRSLRLALVYGVGPVMKTDERFLTAPNKFCLQVARGEALVVSETGLRPHALIHVVDAARAARYAAELADSSPYLALNAASEVASIVEVAQTVVKVAASLGLAAQLAASAFLASPDVAGRPVPSRLAEAGFQPARALEEGLRETLGYYVRRIANT
jgi:UDP-glucose 4-epimerase